MSKITRKLQKIFGGNVPPSGNIAVFGSLAADEAQFAVGKDGNADPDLIQSLPDAFGKGWRGATRANNVAPLQDMNALQYLFSYQLAYIFQSGVPEWLATQEYYLDSLCSRNGVIYISTSGSTNPDNPNIGNDPATRAGSNFWRPYASITIGITNDTWPDTRANPPPKGHLHYDTNTDFSRWITWDGSKWTTIEGAPGDIKYVSAPTLPDALLRNPGWVQFTAATRRVLAAAAEHTPGKGNESTVGRIEDESVTLTIAQFPPHAHTLRIMTYARTGGGTVNKVADSGAHQTSYADFTTASVGGGQPVNIMQPTLYAWCLIKT